MIEKSGNYRQEYERIVKDEFGVERLEITRSWYSVYRPGEIKTRKSGIRISEGGVT